MKTSTALFAALLLLSAAPAWADTCTTQTPPSPASNMGPASSCNSLPPGEATAQFPTFGGALSVTRFDRNGEWLPAAPQQPQVVTPRIPPSLAGSE